VLAATGSFDRLTDYVMFSAWLFYGLTGFSVFLFRKRLPNLPRHFRVPGYPWVPILFVFLAAVLVVNTIIESTRDSLIGLGLILTGLPVYFIFFRPSSLPNKSSSL
jgi:basic amino acid/polyamine antiporter, APA family